jgi:hypothetical protein
MSDGESLWPAEDEPAHAYVVKGNGHAAAGKLRSKQQCSVDHAGAVSLADFYAYMPMHNYIYVPTRETWPAASVNGRIPPVPLVDAASEPVFNEEDKPVKQKASTWLDKNKPVKQMTWGAWAAHADPEPANTWAVGSIIRASPASTSIGQRSASRATQQRPPAGSMMSIWCTPRKPSTSSAGLLIGCSILGKN